MTNDELRTLVKRSILLSKETRTEVLENLETLDKDQRKKLEELLVAAQKKQETFFLTALKNNPNLLTQIKEHLQKATIASIKERENTSQAKEGAAIGDLEDTINTMFE